MDKSLPASEYTFRRVLERKAEALKNNQQPDSLGADASKIPAKEVDAGVVMFADLGSIERGVRQIDIGLKATAVKVLLQRFALLLGSVEQWIDGPPQAFAECVKLLDYVNALLANRPEDGEPEGLLQWTKTAATFELNRFDLWEASYLIEQEDMRSPRIVFSFLKEPEYALPRTVNSVVSWHESGWMEFLRQVLVVPLTHLEMNQDLRTLAGRKIEDLFLDAAFCSLHDRLKECLKVTDKSLGEHVIVIDSLGGLGSHPELWAMDPGFQDILVQHREKKRSVVVVGGSGFRLTGFEALSGILGIEYPAMGGKQRRKMPRLCIDLESPSVGYPDLARLDLDYGGDSMIFPKRERTFGNPIAPRTNKRAIYKKR